MADVSNCLDVNQGMPLKPHFFPSPAAWREWLEEHHAETKELWVGLYKRDSGRPSITWLEAVDGALCFGRIDGLRKSVDALSYKIRFTPRKPRSIWSAVNVRRVTELSNLGLMHSAALGAFEKREGNRSEIYSYEQRKAAKLPSAYEKRFHAPGGVEVLPSPSPLVSENFQLVGYQREKRRNEIKTPGYAHRGFRASTNAGGSHSPTQGKVIVR